MIKGGYRAFTKLNELCIELIRQFYDETQMLQNYGRWGGKRLYYI